MSPLVGPSPRAWGFLVQTRCRLVRQRSIPTRVGISRRLPRACGLPPVHPHARGDFFVFTVAVIVVFGPSPRAWGFRRLHRRRDRRVRSIPTRVGISTGSASRPRPSAVHPHARGDFHVRFAWPVGEDGPSPRAWGNFQSQVIRASHRWRSIPTRVGISPTHATWKASTPVHPHARGDFVADGVILYARFGPSPRAWGFQGAREVARPILRSIPTRVGISALADGSPATDPVHPHARGDFVNDVDDLNSQDGPSPRAWGFHGEVLRHGPADRSIPTRVGISCVGPGAKGRLPVHPHARGDF